MKGFHRPGQLLMALIFFHTFLWVFLPWTIIGLTAYWCRLKTFIKLRFAYNPKYEFLTIGGVTLIFIIISFAQFKLPHYLNITIPLFSVLSASYIYSLYRYAKKKAIKAILGVQYFILSLVFIVSVLICFFVFKFESWYAYGLLVSGLVLIVYFCLKREEYYLRIITLSVYSSLLLNVVLNTHFYPSLLDYQAGSSMAKVIKDNSIPVDNIYKLSPAHTWALDFYNQKPVTIASLSDIKDKKDIWVYVSDEELKLLNDEGFDWDRQYSESQFRITRLQLKFLDPATRKKVLKKRHLIHIY